MQNTTHLPTMTGTALALGIMLTVSSTASMLHAQLSAQGSLALPVPHHAATLQQGPLHGAAPMMTPVAEAQPHAQLVLGMSFILIGFGLALVVQRREPSERPVRIRITPPEITHRPRRLSRQKKVYWMQVSL